MTDTVTDSPTLDALLAVEATRPRGLHENMTRDDGPWATPARVEGFRNAAADTELHLDEALSALAVLFGPAVVTSVRAHVDHLEAVVHNLADCAVDALHTAREADGDHLRTRTERDRARHTAVLLEGALTAAAEREHRVRGVLADLNTAALDDDGQVPDDVRAAHTVTAERLRAALLFDVDHDPRVNPDVP